MSAVSSAGMMTVFSKFDRTPRAHSKVKLMKGFHNKFPLQSCSLSVSSGDSDDPSFATVSSHHGGTVSYRPPSGGHLHHHHHHIRGGGMQGKLRLKLC